MTIDKKSTGSVGNKGRGKGTDTQTPNKTVSNFKSKMEYGGKNKTTPIKTQTNFGGQSR